MVLLLAGCTSENDTDFLLDLTTCSVGGRSLEAVLKKDAQGQYGPESPLVISALSSQGFSFGMCGLDPDHGQAMLVKFSELDQNQANSPLVNPQLSYGMTQKSVETLFGSPDVPSNGKLYKKKLLSGNRWGNTGMWASICPGFSLQFTFDQDYGLTRLIVFPTDLRKQ